MPATFQIEIDSPRMRDVLVIPSIDVVEDVDPGAPWPRSGACLHLYRRGVSTRPVEVDYQSGRLIIRIMSCAAREDIELAIALTGKLAERNRGQIFLESGETISVAELPAKFDRAWSERTIAEDVAHVVEMVRTGKVVVLAGPIRSFHFGRETLKRLGTGHDMVTRFISAMRRVQYAEDEGYYASESLVVRGPNGREVSLATWGPGVRYLFPPTPFVALGQPPAPPIVIPAAAARELGGARVTPLDEKHWLLEAIPENEWATLLKAARKHQTNPFR